MPVVTLSTGVTGDREPQHHRCASAGTEETLFLMKCPAEFKLLRLNYHSWVKAEESTQWKSYTISTLSKLPMQFICHSAF